jgi:hypothetical protein
MKILFLFLMSTYLLAIENDKELELLKQQASELLEKINEYELKRNLEQTKPTTYKNTTKSAAFVQKQNGENITDDAGGFEAPINQKGFLELKSADTTLNIGGRIQLHGVYAWPEGKFYAGDIPIDGGDNYGELFMSARDSRFWIKTRTPSELGMIRALIETDFWGSSGNEKVSNSYGMRLRHALVQIGNLSAGQTNSFFNTPISVDTITAPVNDTFIRQPLLAYSFKQKDSKIDVSFEQPESTLLDNQGTIITPQNDKIPDIVARVEYYPKWGIVSVALLNRYINYANSAIGKDGAYGWGTNLSAKYKLYKLDDIRFNAQYGVGMGRYLAYNAFAAGSLDKNGNIKLQPSFGANIAYRHWWSDKWRSNIVLSYAGADNDTDNIAKNDLSNVTKDVWATQANLLYIPIQNTLVGLEYAKAKRQVESDEHGDMDVILMLLRYDF